MHETRQKLNIFLQLVLKYLKMLLWLGGVTTSFPQSATTGYHAGSVLAMEDEYHASAISIDMNGAVQSYMQVGSQRECLCRDMIMKHTKIYLWRIVKCRSGHS